MISSPHTLASITSLVKTFPGLEKRRANNSNSFFGSNISSPLRIATYFSVSISNSTFESELTLDSVLLRSALILLNKTLGFMGLFM